MPVDQNTLFETIVSTLSFAMALLFAGYLITEKRQPGSTVAWLFFIFLMPLVGIPLFLFLGKRKLRLGLTKKHPIQELDHGKVCMNSILWLHDGISIHEAFVKQIRNANQSIWLETFKLGRDEVSREIMLRLIEKAKEGVQVRLLLDAVGSMWLNWDLIHKLKQAGGEVSSFMPIFSWKFRGHSNLRNHRKIYLFDEQTAIFGGMNLAKEYFGSVPDPNRWVDLGLQIKGPMVKKLGRVFESDWNFATEQEPPVIAHPTLSTSAQMSDEFTESMELRLSGPDVEQDDYYDEILTQIFSAKERIWLVTPYFTPDDALTRGLEIAARRGVDVRIILPNQSDHLLPDLARGSFLRQLEGAGAKVFLFPKMIHAKAGLFDSTCCVVGSGNFDMRSFFLNFEVNSLIRSKRSIETLSDWMEQLCLSSKTGYPNKTVLNEMGEGIGRVLSPMI